MTAASYKDHLPLKYNGSIGEEEEDTLKGYNDSHGYIDDVSSNEIIKIVIIGRKRRQPNSEHCIPPMLKD